MNTPDLIIRPCDAPTARRRADRVGGCRMWDVGCRMFKHAAHPPTRTHRRAGFHIPHPTSHIRLSPAFSLLELTIVLAIIVSVSAIALPRYWSSVGRYRVEMAARRIAADLALAKSSARGTGQFRNCVFDATLPYYELTEERSLTRGASANYAADLSREPYQVSITAFAATDGGRRITFDGFGQPAQGLTLTLRAAGHTRTVRVDQSTGAISVTTP